MTKLALITGASQGIGAQIARTLASDVDSDGQPRFRLALVATNQSRLEGVARSCGDVETLVCPCDLRSEEEVQSMAACVEEVMGTPDLVINNAGRFVQGDLMTMDLGAFDEVLRVNLHSAFLVSRAFIPAMEKRGNGTILFMGSVASTKAYQESGAYTVAKHGLLGLARCLRESTKSSGLRVTAIMPGATWSPSWQGTKADELRLMPAEDIAQCVLDIYRLSERSVVEEITLRPQLGDLD